jgi:hypothetical protein
MTSLCVGHTVVLAGLRVVVAVLLGDDAGMLYACPGAGGLVAGMVLQGLLLLSGYEEGGQEEQGEEGERRASTRRPARTRHCARGSSSRRRPGAGGEGAGDGS